MRFGKIPVMVLVAAGLLGSIGFGGLLFSTIGNQPQTAPAETPAEATSVLTHLPGVARDGAVVPPTPSPTPTVAPSPTPTSIPAANPLAGLRIWAGGDSVGAFVVQSFASDMVAAGAAPDCTLIASSPGQVEDTCYFWKISTGLSRLDYYDWLGELQTAADAYHPDVMLFMVGGNDAQGLLSPDGAVVAATPFSPSWDAAYAARVSQAMDIMTANGRHGVWVGMPIMLDTNEYPGYNANMQKLNVIFQAEAAAHPRIAYVDAYALTSDPDGDWTEYFPDIHGVVQQMRVSEGVHLTTTGGEFLAQHAIEALKALLQP